MTTPVTPPRKSYLGRAVFVGTATLALAGALTPQPNEFNAVTGAVYGFLLGALAGVLIDRRRPRA